MKDYKVKIKVYNGKLSAAIEDAGYNSFPKFAAAAGISYPKLNHLLNMTDSAVNKKGELHPDVIQVCVFLNKEPSQLFNDVQMYDGLRVNTSNIYLDEVEVSSLMCRDPSSDPSALLEEKDTQNIIDNILATLTPKEQTIVRLLYGLDGEEKTLADAGKDFDLTRERVRQIEAKALRKLRHLDRRDLYEGLKVPPKYRV